jgi:hypothetical protein
MPRTPLPPHLVLAHEVSGLAADAPLADRVLPLLRNLALTSDTSFAGLWMPVETSGPQPSWSSVATFDTDFARPAEVSSAPMWAGPVVTLEALRERPGVRAVMPVTDAGQIVGAIVLGDRAPGPAGDVPEALLAQSQSCVALLIREYRLDGELRRRIGLADQLAAGLSQVEGELATVLEVERRRLSGWVLAGTNRQLAEVMRQRQALMDAVDHEPGRALGALQRLRLAVDELIEAFRTVVRGVYPAMLRDRGPCTALIELATQLPRRVRITGDLGRRTGWEVESGLYHATAAALHLLSDLPGAPLTVHFDRLDERLEVRVRDPAPRPLAALRAELADDGRRLTALGGGLRCQVSAGGTMVDLWLPPVLSGATSDRDQPGDPGACGAR